MALEIAFALGMPVIIVGHSWGAGDALRLAQIAVDRGIPVDLLVTLDPVTKFGRDDLVRVRDGIGQRWINVDATGKGTISDFVESIGGSMPQSNQLLAGSGYFRSAAHHNEVGRMMRESGAQRQIVEIQRQYGVGGR